MKLDERKETRSLKPGRSTGRISVDNLKSELSI